MQRQVWLPFGVLLLTGSRAFAVPSAPPTPQVVEQASKIVMPPAPDDVAAYGARFAPNVHVYFNGELIARDRSTWLKIAADPSGPHIHVMRLATGNPIIAVEEASTAGAPEFKGSVVIIHDCCSWARTATFHLNDNGQVDEVRIADGQSDWMPPSTNGQRR